MIKFKNTYYNLKTKQYDFIDTTSNSKYCFNLVNFPDKLYAGKNLITVSANLQNLATDSPVLIDIEDANENPIYYEVLDFQSKDNNRSIAVYIYPDAPIGVGMIYISGVLKRNPLTNEPAGTPYSVLWKREIQISPLESNQSLIRFYAAPEVTYCERRELLYEPTLLQRYTVYTASVSSSLTISAHKLPYQFAGSTKQVESRTESQIPIVRRADAVNSGSSLLAPVSASVGVTSPNFAIPEYSQLPALSSENFQFKKSMTGASVTVRNITVPAPSDSGVSVFTAPDFSTSIVEVKSQILADVSNPFSFTKQYTNLQGVERHITYDRFTSAGNFTMSYYDSVPVVGTTTTQSFATFEFRNLSPAVGTVDYVQFYSKPIGQFGEFSDIGKFYITEKNLMVHSSSIIMDSKLGMIEQPLSWITSAEFLADNWVTDLVDVGRRSGGVFENGMYIEHTEAYSPGAVGLIRPASGFVTSENTQYKLSLFATSSVVGENFPPTVDIYMSGSVGVVTEKITNGSTPDSVYGTYIGSMYGKHGVKEYNFYFLTQKKAVYTPIFIIRSGNWEISELNVSAVEDVGFTPGHTKIHIPMTQLQTSAELTMKIEYYNNSGVKSDFQTELYGVYFSGSTDANSSTPLPSGLISSSTQIIYSQISGIPLLELSYSNGRLYASGTC